MEFSGCDVGHAEGSSGVFSHRGTFIVCNNHTGRALFGYRRHSAEFSS